MQASKLSESLLGLIVRLPDPLSLNRKSILSEMVDMWKIFLDFFRTSLASHRVGMDGDSVDGCFHSFQRSVVLWIDWYPFKLIQSVPAVYHLPKHRVPWREKCKDQMFTRTFWSSAHLRSRDGWGAYVRNHWLPLEFGPELAIERTPLVLCFKSSLISSWCYRFGLNEETPQWSGVGGMVA